MKRSSLPQRASAPSIQPAWYPDDLLPELQRTLAALADVECRYEVLKEQLQASGGTPATKEPLLRGLEQQRHHEQKPLHDRLAELHYHMLKVAIAQEIL
jgi:hypothetical protein